MLDKGQEINPKKEREEAGKNAGLLHELRISLKWTSLGGILW
jgi:hypothetical protein